MHCITFPVPFVFQHVEKMLKQKDLQCQLAEAKMAKQQIEVTEDKEKMLLEKKSLLEVGLPDIHAILLNLK